MDHVILWRNTQNGKVSFVSDEDGEIAVFPNEEAAVDAADNTTVCKAFPYQIVELGEL